MKAGPNKPVKKFNSTAELSERHRIQLEVFLFGSFYYGYDENCSNSKLKCGLWKPFLY